MSELKLTLSADHANRVRGGETVTVDDSAGRTVFVSLHARADDGRPRLQLTAADLTVAAEPDGLVCPELHGTGGWTVRVLP